MLKTVGAATLEWAIVIVILTNAAFPQTALLGENCDLSIIGANETKSFLAFDHEFREALSKQDAGMMALLVRYPFRINDDHGSYYLDDAGSLQARFQEIFTPAVRATVLKQRSETVSCLPTGIMYGDGVVWVNLTGQRYALEAVNLPEGSRSVRAQVADRVEFVCNADKHRVIIDAGPSGEPRYRAWNRPRPLTEKPDIEIPKGKEDSEGSGPCRYTTWTFTNVKATFTVDGPGGCFEDSKQPPADARGSLAVSVPGKPVVSWWCR